MILNSIPRKHQVTDHDEKEDYDDDDDDDDDDEASRQSVLALRDHSYA